MTEYETQKEDGETMLLVRDNNVRIVLEEILLALDRINKFAKEKNLAN